MKKNENAIRNKGILSLVLIILLFILVRFALLYIGARLGETRENELIQLKMSAMTDIVSDANAKTAAAAERVSDRLTAETRLMTGMLKEFCTDGDYSGPRTLPGGFVAELRGSRVILPPEAEGETGQLSRETVEEGLRSGNMVSVSAADASEEDADAPVFFSFGEIAENFVYVNVLSESEYSSYLDRYSGHIYDTLQLADESFGGMTLVVSYDADTDAGDSLQVLRRFGTIEGEEEFLDPELLLQTVRQRSPILTLNERDYAFSVSQLEDGTVGDETRYVVQIIPEVSVREQNTSRTLLVVILMVIIFIAVAVYVISVQHYTAKHQLTPEQAAHYTAEAMRKRMISLGILSAVLVFGAAVLVESVGQLYMELRYGRDTLRLFSGQVEKENRHQLMSISEEEESWYLYYDYGEEMAALIADHPELAAPEKLQEYCDCLDIDYIMLFDSDGNEVSCSRDYVGFTLGDSPEDERFEFRQLLHGVPGIIHKAAYDPETHLER